MRKPPPPRICPRCSERRVPNGRGHRFCGFCARICPKCMKRTKAKSNAYCKGCLQVYLARYYALNRERILSRVKAYQAEFGS